MRREVLELRADLDVIPPLGSDLRVPGTGEKGFPVPES